MLRGINETTGIKKVSEHCSLNSINNNVRIEQYEKPILQQYDSRRIQEHNNKAAI